MAITNQERVGKAMEFLQQGLAPFVEREFSGADKAQATSQALRSMGRIASRAKSRLLNGT